MARGSGAALFGRRAGVYVSAAAGCRHAYHVQTQRRPALPAQHPRVEPHGSVQQARRILRRQLLLRFGRGAVRVRPAAWVSTHLRPAGLDHSKPGAGLQHHAHCGLRSQCGRYVRDRSGPDPLSFRRSAGRRGIRLWAPTAGLCESLPVPGRVVSAFGAPVRYPPVARRRVGWTSVWRR